MAVATKRRPGIPHETLAYIVEQSGGAIEHFTKDRDTWVRFTKDDRTLEAPNNTALLIQILELI